MTYLIKYMTNSGHVDLATNEMFASYEDAQAALDAATDMPESAARDSSNPLARLSVNENVAAIWPTDLNAVVLERMIRDEPHGPQEGKLLTERQRQPAGPAHNYRFLIVNGDWPLWLCARHAGASNRNEQGYCTGTD